MINSFKVFMEEIIDYAGLFPPADLSLDTSIQKYSKYRKSQDSWMLSRYIIPSSRLDELEPYQDTVFQEGKPFAFSVLGKGTEMISDYWDHLQDIIKSIKRFHSTHGDRVTTEILEIKLPREAVLANDADLMAEIYEETSERLDRLELLPNQVFFEGFFEVNWKKEVRLILETLHKHNQEFNAEYQHHTGFKLRCGGTESEMFPSVEQVAFTLNNARDNNVILKCTAGLHHPIRHYADSVKTKMHGFFNVFGGAMLSYVHHLSDDDLIDILREEDPGYFTFTEKGFQWKDLMVSTQEITRLRDKALISFGSCSFDEPRDDLKRLELL